MKIVPSGKFCKVCSLNLDQITRTYTYKYLLLIFVLSNLKQKRDLVDRGEFLKVLNFFCLSNYFLPDVRVLVSQSRQV